MLQGSAYGGTHASGGTSADGVDDDHGRAWLRGGAVDVGRGAEFLHSGFGQFLAHRDEHEFGIHSGSLMDSRVNCNTGWMLGRR
jgi:hypothetical protein